VCWLWGSVGAGNSIYLRAVLGIFVFMGKNPVFLQIVDAFHDKIQNAAYSYSGSWLWAGQDEEEDAELVWIVGRLSTFHHVRFYSAFY
jgi:hypothetical protein